MNKNKKDWRQSVSISKFPMMLLFGILLSTSTLSYAQLPVARMEVNNKVTVKTGLNPSYTVNVAHFDFATIQEANAYFQARDVNYIDFVVIDTETVKMDFDLTDPAVANWTMADWNQALSTRATNSLPRTLPTN